METVDYRASVLVASARRRAEQKGIPFSLTKDAVAASLALGRCFATGLPLDFAINKDYRMNPFAPSLDRIDPSEGYTTDNIRITCAAYNVGRGQWGDEVFLKVAHAAVQNEERLLAPEAQRSSSSKASKLGSDTTARKQLARAK